MESDPHYSLDRRQRRCPGYAIAWVTGMMACVGQYSKTCTMHLELGHAIAIHKAQGSQWPRVIVPLTGNRLLDRTLVCMAVTHAQTQVLIFGDEVAVRTAWGVNPEFRRGRSVGPDTEGFLA